MLECGFTFAGRHVSEFDAAFMVTKLPMAAAPDINKTSIAGRNGSLRYPGKTYGEKTLEGTLYLQDADDELISDTELLERISVISAWLQTDGREQLALDAQPERFYLAEVESEVTASTDKWENGACAVKFTLQPFAYHCQTSATKATLLAGVPQEIPLSVPGTVPAPIMATIEATEALDWVDLSCNGKLLRLENLGMEPGSVLKIMAGLDIDEIITIEADGRPSMDRRTENSAEQLFARPGVNTITAQASGGCSLTLEARGRWK